MPELTYRLYRSATDPEFIEAEIEPVLSRYGRPRCWAVPIAQMMDGSGWSAESAISALDSVVKAYEPEESDDGR